jgi:branched-chain amino acid transport system ATP-binding protein
MEALDRVGLSSRAAVRVSELSHGEKRLLEIAMALAMRPRIFLMDEPMAGLGQEGLGQADRLSRQVEVRSPDPADRARHGRRVPAGRPDLGAGCRRIIARGTADEIRNHPEVRTAYLGEDEA